MKIKNWDNFQHYKHRSMPWFKLYGRDLLNDIDWHALNCSEKSTLLELWCLASEDNGKLPTIEKIAFRLRKEVNILEPIIQSLLDKGWLYSSSIDNVYTNSTLEEKRKDKKIKDKKESNNESPNTIPF